jgi:Iron-dependent Transcriptional regulator
MIDVRFPTALQIMLSLALAEQQSVSRLSSKQLAQSLGANPSFVRKLLVPLVQNKLLSSQMGKAGGVRLARPAAEIKTARFQRDYNGKQPGDPTRAAAALLKLASVKEPPLRIVLGIDAFNAAEANGLAKIELGKKWKDLSYATDFVKTDV